MLGIKKMKSSLTHLLQSRKEGYFKDWANAYVAAVGRKQGIERRTGKRTKANTRRRPKTNKSKTKQV